MELSLPLDAQHTDAGNLALGLLEAGIPWSLLLDLATPVQSSEIYRSEPCDANWLGRARIA